jgi:transcriptional regulator with XRE-family HTH domain
MRMIKIRRIREEKGITQKELAFRCKLRPATICDLEKGRIKNPRIHTLLKIVKELETTLDVLFDFSA